MVEIKRKVTGEVLLTVKGDSLAGVNMSGSDLFRADLRGADLKDAYLSGANLRGADMRDANLTAAVITRADLAQANLTRADVTRADLTFANLSGCDLTFANLRGTRLVAARLPDANLTHTLLTQALVTGADLGGAHLANADLTGSDVTGAKLNGCNLSFTTFAWCAGLHLAMGLETVRHTGPCALDRHTLQAGIGTLPDVFLEGCGYSRLEIETLRALYTKSPIRFFSCFISHAESDLPFADRLLADLRQSNVTCWHYKEDMRGGEDWAEQVNRAIKVHDKLLLVCSRRSVYRKNVVNEILAAINAERETGEQKLFPIRLDDHILGPDMTAEAHNKVRSGEWAEDWVYYVKKKHIPDFAGWDTDNAKYATEFKKLLEALRRPAGTAEPSA